jgi:hypothetical protein
VSAGNGRIGAQCAGIGSGRSNAPPMRDFDRRTTGDRETFVLRRLRVVQRAVGAGGAGHDAAHAVVPDFPLKVQIQTSTRCNAACAMCPYPAVTSEPGFDHAQMPEELYRAILAQLRGRGVERLSLFLMNEPLLDKRMPRWIALAREALPDATLNLFSNGSALTAKLARALAAAGLDELCVSVHGFEPAVYEAVMQGLSYARLEQNLRSALELYRAGELGRLALSVVAGDVPEVAGSLARADPILRDHVLLKAFSNEREVAVVPRGLGSSRELAAPLAPLCQRPFVKLYVLARGECVLCNCDWRRTVVLGRLGTDARAQTIEQVWNGARYRAVRAQHVDGAFERGLLCAGCDYPAVAGFAEAPGEEATDAEASASASASAGAGASAGASAGAGAAAGTADAAPEQRVGGAHAET